MTTATESRISCHLLRKLSAEMRPPMLIRRDERIKSVSSFEEIVESEEEEIQETPSWNGGRSPFAVCSESPFAQRRSNSLTHNPLISPKMSKRSLTPRLLRGFSDPVMRRKSSLPCLSRLSPERIMEEDTDSLELPPIPEAATPVSPNTINDAKNDENDTDSSDD